MSEIQNISNRPPSKLVPAIKLPYHINNGVRVPVSKSGIKIIRVALSLSLCLSAREPHCHHYRVLTVQPYIQQISTATSPNIPTTCGSSTSSSPTSSLHERYLQPSSHTLQTFGNHSTR